jgi:hypothetical protein
MAAVEVPAAKVAMKVAAARVAVKDVAVAPPKDFAVASIAGSPPSIWSTSITRTIVSFARC